MNYNLKKLASVAAGALLLSGGALHAQGNGNSGRCSPPCNNPPDQGGAWEPVTDYYLGMSDISTDTLNDAAREHVEDSSGVTVHTYEKNTNTGATRNDEYDYPGESDVHFGN